MVHRYVYFRSLFERTFVLFHSFSVIEFSNLFKCVTCSCYLQLGSSLYYKKGLGTRFIQGLYDICYHPCRFHDFLFIYFNTGFPWYTGMCILGHYSKEHSFYFIVVVLLNLLIYSNVLPALVIFNWIVHFIIKKSLGTRFT